MVIVLVFLISFTDTYSQVLEEHIIRPNGLMADDRLGENIILTGNFLFISATGDDDPEINKGSVYIFESDELNWQQVQRISCPSPKPNTFFGSSLAIKNDVLLIGANNDSSNGFPTGVAYFYEKGDDNWLLMQKIVPNPDNGIVNKNFGASLDFSDSLIIIGANTDGNHIDSLSGSVYIFRNENGFWLQEKKIIPEKVYDNGDFGSSVVLDGEYAIIGYQNSSENASGSGSVYIYKRTGRDWNFEQKLFPIDPQSEQFFGSKISLFKNRLVISAPGSISAPQSYLGTVYIFVRENGRWLERYKITPDSDSIFSFGASVKLDNDSLLIGALTRSLTNNYRGRGFLYTIENDEWVKQIEFSASDGHSVDFFGGSCDMQDGIFIFGAPGNNVRGSRAGAVYVYQEKSVSVEDNEIEIPSGYILYQNYPNPFNPSTTIEFSLPEDGFVTLKVYDILGRDVKTLIEDYRNKGKNSVEFFAGNISGGVYFYEIKVNDFVDRGKMILMK